MLDAVKQLLPNLKQKQIQKHIVSENITKILQVKNIVDKEKRK